MILGAERVRDLVDFAVFASLPGVMILSWLVGRLLGVRRSWSITLASGVIGWIAGVALALTIASQRPHPSSGFTRNVWLFSAFGVMSATIWVELLAKPGTLARAQTGLTSIPHPIRAVRRRGQRVSRYAQITRIALRNGLGPSLGLGRHAGDGEDGHAAASIGQAHRAQLHGGQQVIVKVQRPGIAESVNRDLDVLGQLAQMVEQRTA